MRKLATIGVAAISVPALASVTFAQTIDSPSPAKVTVTGKVTPSKGGSLKKPKNAKTKIVFKVNKESFSTLAGIRYSIPKSVRISGKGFKRCTADMINAEGEGACPKGSKVGTGASTALLGPSQTAIQFSVNVYAAGAKRLTLALQQVNGDVNVPFDAKITKSSVSFSIPDNVQQPVPGLFSYVTSVTANLGRTNGKSVVKRVGCFGGKDTTRVILPLTANPNPPAKDPISGSDSAKCRK